jgi:hypothetical protein
MEVSRRKSGSILRAGFTNAASEFVDIDRLVQGMERMVGDGKRRLSYLSEIG